jgi:hypothetical protein
VSLPIVASSYGWSLARTPPKTKTHRPLQPDVHDAPSSHSQRRALRWQAKPTAERAALNWLQLGKPCLEAS